MAKITERRIAACLAAACVSMATACSGGNGQSVTTPSATGPTNVAGAWSGTLTFNGTVSQGPIAMTLAQAPGAGTVSGAWTGKNEWSGTVDGSVSGSTFAGQLVWNYTASGQAVSKCSATVSVVGNAGGSAMTWTSTSVNRAPGSVFCDLGMTSLRIDATK
jgi:hypothetical protein